jgi:CheY-like chemotaxis protein
LPTRTLLLADDSLTIHKLVSLSFAGEDVRVEAVLGGEEAIEKAKSLRPDVIMADVFMPGKGGYEVCEAVKNDPELSAIPVILLIGTFEPFDASEASRVGCDGHLTKPFDSGELVEMVRALAERGAAAAQSTPGCDRRATPETTLVSARTRESFLGSGSILDLFGPGCSLQPASVSTDALEAIVERIVRRLAREVVDELAREIVPQVTEAWVKQRAGKGGV